MTRRVIVVGGDAAGMSAASTAKKRLGDDIEIVVLERGVHTSYSACGIPYWVGGIVDGPDALVVRTPEQHRERGIDVRTHHEVTAIDAEAATVEVRTPDGEQSLAYDELVIATGAEPVRPDLPGIDAEGIHGLQSLDDGCRLIDGFARDPRRVVVVGAGYIGVEVAEACVERGLEVTVVDAADAPLGMVEPDLGARVHVAMEALGIDVRVGTGVEGFETADGRVTGVVTSEGTLPADLVVLGLGVRPRSDLARAAGLPIGEGGGILTDEHQRVAAASPVWAAGDCVETHHRLLGRPVPIALATHANKQGWVIGRNLGGGDPTATFPGAIGTAMTKVCDLEVGVTGLGEAAARDAGFDPVRISIEATTKVGYFPGAEPMTVSMVCDRTTRRVLGCQVVGRTGSALRIDSAALAVWNAMTVDELMMSDLGYAPPFSPTWDPVQTAARALASQLGY